MFLKHSNLPKKSDKQQKYGGKEMLPHFPPKPHLKRKQQKFKSSTLISKFELNLKLFI
jgi:hypothetical protein